jgi:hypothetical protein
MFRKGIWKKKIKFLEMGRLGEKKCQHLGKLPRSIHGKLPIERHFSQQAADQTYIF